MITVAQKIIFDFLFANYDNIMEPVELIELIFMVIGGGLRHRARKPGVVAADFSISSSLRLCSISQASPFYAAYVVWEVK